LLELLAGLFQNLLHLTLADQRHRTHGNLLHGLFAFLDRAAFFMPRLHCLAGSNIFAQVDRVFLGLVAFASNECLDRLGSWYESFFTT
jgi:hypothetical protein